MFRTVLSIGCVVALLVMPACSGTYYYPTYQNVGSFTDRGDVYVYGGNDVYSLGGAAGYAITDNVGVIASYRRFRSDYAGPPNYIGYLVEPEVALFKGWKRPGEEKATLYPSLHATYGYGKLAGDQDYFSLNFSRVSLQPGIAYSSDYFDVGLSARVAAVWHNYDQLKTFDLDPNRGLREYFGLYEVGEKTFGFIEPAFSIGGGYKAVKVRFQTVIVTQLNGETVLSPDVTFFISVFVKLNTRTIREANQSK